MKGLHGLIFTYIPRENLLELTASRAPASVPFGGRYRIIDFALSNLVDAGVQDVGVLVHGRYQSLLDHIGTGKSWDLSKKRGGLKILPPFRNVPDASDAPFRGKMESLADHRSYIENIRQDHVVLMEGDIVTNLPLRKIYESHLRSKADITAVCGDDSFFVDNGTYFQTDGNGRVNDIFFNVHTPRGRRSLEVYILSKKLLLQLIDNAVEHDRYSFRRDVLQANKDDLVIKSYIWSGYAAQIRSVKEYYDRSMQLLTRDIRDDLFCPARPISAKSADMASAYIAPGSSCRNSIVADGCKIEGTVENSILFPGVKIGKGAIVRNSVLFKETEIGERCEAAFIIADKRVRLNPGTVLVGSATYPVVVSKGSVV